MMDFEESLDLWKQERTFIRVNPEMMPHRGAILRTALFRCQLIFYVDSLQKYLGGCETLSSFNS